MCTLSITSVTPVYSQGILSQITVVGSTTDCDVVDVQIRCVKIALLKQIKIAANNVFTATFQAADLNAAGCQCGGPITVDVACANGKCKAPPWTGTLACCPEITVSAVAGECNGDGERLVMLSAQNAGPATANASWSFGDGSGGPPFALPVGPAIATQHAYPPGTYTAVLKVQGCPDRAVQITAPPCCTKLVLSAQAGECDENGRRTVTLVAQNAGGTGVSPHWDYGDGLAGPSFGVAPGTSHSEQHSYPPGFYTATLHVPGCPDQTVSFTVAVCCPALTVWATMGECKLDGTRQVTLHGSRAGPGSAVLSWSFGDGSPNGPAFSLGAGTASAVNHSYAPGTYTATLGGGKKCPPQSVTFTVPPCCPAVSVSALPGKGCHEGVRIVTLQASNAGPSGVLAYWEYGDGSQDEPVSTLVPGTPHLTPHAYPPGTYTATLVIGGCPAQTVTFTVPPCCPDITVSVQLGECNADGTRAVKLQTSSAGPGTVQGHWTFGDGSPDGMAFTINPNTWSFEQHFYPPGTHTATLKIPGCPDESVTFNVPACCPVVTISARIGECQAGTRSVTLSASSTGPGTVNAFWVFGDGSLNGAPFPLGPGVSGAEQHLYAAGQYTATLIVSGCPAQSITINVAPCEPCPPCPPGCATLPGCTGLPGCAGCGGCLCGLLCLLWVVLLAGYLLGIATGALATVVGLVAATVVLVLFAVLYILLCGVCSLVKCTIKALVVFIVAVILALLFGVVLAGLGPALIVAVGLFLLALLVHRRFCPGSIWF